MQLDPAGGAAHSRVTAFQIRTVALCALIGLIDGLDIQTMAIATPRIAEKWGIAPSAFGPVLSASFAGIMLGTMLLGQMGDRLGRRRVVLASFTVVGLASIATALSQSIAAFVVLRFITGFAIGGCLPNVTALTAEYVPAPHTGRAVTIMYSAVPLGGVLGGFVGGALIDLLDWQGVFIAGGVVPLFLLIFMFAWLPESKQHLDRRAHAGVTAEESGGQVEAGRLSDLFRGERLRTTAVLWPTFFASMAALYLLTSWLPTIFTGAGWSLAAAIRTIAFFQLGGVIGGIFFGWLIDKLDYRVLTVGFIFGAVMAILTGVVNPASDVLPLLVALTGFGIVGTQLSLTAVCAKLYPTEIRATGIGWALGIGRFGAVLSPLLGGIFLSSEWGGMAVFVGAAVLVTFCAAMVLALIDNKHRKNAAQYRTA